MGGGNFSKWFRDMRGEGYKPPKICRQFAFRCRGNLRAGHGESLIGEAGYHVFSAGAVGYGQHVVNRCKPQRWSFAEDEGRIPIMHIRIRNQTAEAPQRGQSVGIPPLQPASRVKPFGRIAPRRVHFSKKGRVVRIQRDKGNTAPILRAVKSCNLQKSPATSINPIDFRNMEAWIGKDGRCHRLSREQIRPAFTLGC